MTKYKPRNAIAEVFITAFVTVNVVTWFTVVEDRLQPTLD